MMRTELRRAPRARGLVCGLLVVIGLMGAACSSSSSGSTGGASGTLPPEGKPVSGGSMVVSVSVETDGWNPHDDEWSQSSTLVGSSVLEPLATMDANLDAAPWLATSWKANADFTAYTIQLRHGVTFQDGEPFDAAAVKANFDDLSKGTLTATTDKGLVTGTKVISQYTIEVDLGQPWAAFPESFLDGQESFMMAPAMLTSAHRGADHPIGTGPFTFKSWTPGGNFVTTRNGAYWQTGKPYLSALTFKVLSDSSTQQAALQSGDVDLALTASPQVANTLGDQGYTVVKDWSSEAGAAIANALPTVNGKPNPMSNVHARLALAYATDRQALATILGAGVEPADSPFPSSSKWGLPFGKAGYPSHDVDQAKAEVAKYESDTGASSLAVTLSSASDPDTQRVAQLLQAQWEQAGIKTTVAPAEGSSLITDVVFGKFQLAIFPIYSSPDPDQNWYFWSSSTVAPYGSVSINFSHYGSPAIDADLAKGRRNPDFATRKAAYDSLIQQLNHQALNIWLTATAYSLVAGKDVHGLREASQVPFGNFQPKTWLADLWMSQS